MTKIIELGNKGSIVIYIENNEIKINNNTSCTLKIDGKPIQPGESV